MTGARILVVDDDPAILLAVRRALEGHEYDVETIEAATLVIDAAARFRPDLVLLDVMLPDGDGVDVLRELRSRPDPAPVIMLSAVEDETRKVLALDAGADDYVTKPFGMNELLARVRVALRRQGTDPTRPWLVCEPIVVDLDRHEVLVEGTPLRLTPTEFDLLRLFVEEQGRVLTQRFILARVWGAQYIDDTHVLRTFVHQLRQKLGAVSPEAAAMLITDPGVGYRLEPS